MQIDKFFVGAKNFAMNILPKKRWHVRTKDNVARVRRDQAQAREEEKRRLERVALAEQESRTTLLRQRAASQRDKEGNALPAAATASGTDEPVHQGHVNFFADLEEQERTFGANKDYEKEKRLEKEAEEKKIGLLKYLGEGSSEYMKETPWYQRAPKRDTVATKPTPTAPSTVKVQHTSAPETVTSSDSKKKRSASKEKKKTKKKRRRRHSSSSSTTSSRESGASERASSRDDGGNHKLTATGPAVDIEKLRNERLRREREERLKAEALLRRMRGEKDIGTSTEQPKQYEQRYSSQFNPDLARQNRPV